MSKEADESKGDGAPDMTPNGRKVWECARVEAARRGHPNMGTEHILWALYNVAGDTPTATRWLIGKGASKEAVVASLEACPSFAPATGGAAVKASAVRTTPRLDLALAAASRIAAKVTAGQLASDSFLVGILAEGRSLGALVLEDVSRGQASITSVLAALGQDAAEFVARQECVRSRTAPWTLYHLTAEGALEGSKAEEAASAAGASMARVHLEEPPALSDSAAIEAKMAGPTYATNWLVPGRVLMGAMPQSRAEVEGVLRAGVTTIVPLVEEISMTYDYPADIMKLMRAKAVPQTAVQIVHFPIEDFECVDEPKHLVAVVEELDTRIRRGEVVFVHCLGGHGRTGTVVISLLAGLFGYGARESRERVLEYHWQRAKCKANKRYRYCHIPEVRSQEKQVKEVNPAMRRGAHKAKLKAAAEHK